MKIGVLITNLKNVRYLTGFTGSSGFAYVENSVDYYFITDGRYTIQANYEVKNVNYEIVTMPIIEFLKKRNLDILVLEDTIAYRELKIYEKCAKKIQIKSDLIESRRQIKKHKELKIIRKAQEITEEVFEKVKAHLVLGMTELDVVEVLRKLYKEYEVYEFSFDPIIAFGENSAKPHHNPTSRRLREGDVIQFDFGCMYKGYCSDFSRVLCFGKSPDNFDEVYNVVKYAQKLVFANARVGMKTRQLDKIARDYITSRGYGKFFNHSLGHSLGLEIHEAPNLSANDDTIIKPGMVFTVEPGIYIPNKFGVRLEDLLIFDKEEYE